MSSLPLPVRVAAGLVVTAVEEVRDLPRTVVGLPISAVSRVLQLTMRAQQMITELAIRGDTALEGARPVEDAPSWARFDDEPRTLAPQRHLPESTGSTGATAGRTNGHALEPALGVATDTSSVTPDALPGYETMTIAQLRGKLRSLDVDQLAELLAWESAHADRPAFVTMLTNRIATLTAES